MSAPQSLSLLCPLRNVARRHAIPKPKRRAMTPVVSRSISCTRSARLSSSSSHPDIEDHAHTNLASEGNVRLQQQMRSAVVAARVAQLDSARALHWPRIESYPDTAAVRSIRRRFEELELGEKDQSQPFHVYGRVMAIRRHGRRLVFVDLLNEGYDLQVQLNWANMDNGTRDVDDFRIFLETMKRGDHIRTFGYPSRNMKGQLTLDAIALPDIVSPSLVPLPEALTDKETKIQHRHIDMLVTPRTADILRLRAKIISLLRNFLEKRNFLEFHTPILAATASGAVARPFTTRATEFPSKELALRIAPELWLKRLVVGGIDKVYELGPAFRNEGIDQSHNPEFTMCEFYQAYTNLDDLINLTEELLEDIADRVHWLKEHSQISLRDDPQLTFVARPYVRFEFIPALEGALNFKLPDLEAEDAFAQLITLLETNNIDLGPEEQRPPTLSKLLDWLAGKYIEPHTDSPTFIMHHPACMAPLAKSFRCAKTQQVVSARAELFMDGFEIANMYEEENDPFAQRRKMQMQIANRDHLDGEIDDEAGNTVLDEGYLEVLEAGLPPTGGWGCGIERLVMIFAGTRRISDCMSFGNLRNVMGLSRSTR